MLERRPSNQGRVLSLRQWAAVGLRGGRGSECDLASVPCVVRDCERCRRRIFVGNCCAISPERVLRRFPEIRAVVMKGKPRFADFNLVLSEWGGGKTAWVEALAVACPQLEELRLKRIVVPDECFELTGRSFRKFKVFPLAFCEGFRTSGLASIASSCRSCTNHMMLASWRSFDRTRTSDASSSRLQCLSAESALLSVAVAGDDDAGLHYILSGSPSLKKL